MQTLHSDLGLSLGMGVVLALTFMGMAIAVTPIFGFAVVFILALTGFYQQRGKHFQQQCKQSPRQEWIHTLRENVRAVRILVSKNRGNFLYRRYLVLVTTPSLAYYPSFSLAISISLTTIRELASANLRRQVQCSNYNYVVFYPSAAHQSLLVPCCGLVTIQKIVCYFRLWV